MIILVLSLLLSAGAPANDSFWQEWERAHAGLYPPGDLRVLQGIYLYGTSSGLSPRDSAGFSAYASKYLDQLRLDSIVAEKTAERKSKYMLIRDSLIRDAVHNVDKFGQYDFWSIPGVAVTGKSHIDMIISDRNGIDDVARFSIETRNKSCMDEDAKILFLLESKKVVTVESVSPFNCKSMFLTRFIKDGEIDSKIVSVRIDGGRNGTYREEFELNSYLKSRLNSYVENARWIQEDVYQQ